MIAFYAVLLALLLSSVSAFRGAAPAKFGPRSVGTELYEDFNLKKTVIISDPLIFSEKQLREYTATYADDVRWNPFEALTGLFSKKDGGSSPSTSSSSVASALKPTISLAVLEEKTAAYVQGKIDAKNFLGVLTAAFGPKLNAVFPEIISSLPKAKADALAKVKK